MRNTSPKGVFHRWIYHAFCFFLQDPKVYVQTILDVHKKYNALVMTAFNNDAGFVAALDKVGNTCSLTSISLLENRFCFLASPPLS